MSKSEKPISAMQYSEEYFLTECDGHAEYLASKGALLSPRLQALWRFLHIRPGMQVLDVGCGRGEVITYCGRNGISAVGVDYSREGLRLARQAITHTEGQDLGTWKRPYLSLSNAKSLPFSDNTFARAVMSDIVEHLYPEELTIVLREVHRMLVPGGKLLIHTMPNLWYYRYGYPLFRLVEKARGISLPTNPRERCRFSYVHVNEQTPRSLRRTLHESNFSRWRIWLHDYRDYSEYHAVMRHSMRLLTSLPLVKRVFCDDIYALAEK